MSSIPERILEKARRLRALAERGGTPAESAAAARKFSELVDRYRIETAQLEEPSELFWDPEPILAGKSALWVRDLALVTARHYGVTVYRTTAIRERPRKRPEREVKFMLLGYRQDIEAARFLFSWLEADAVRIGRTATVGMRRADKRSWFVGFVHGIQLQLHRARETVSVDFVGTPGLVLVENRLAETAAALEKKLDDLGRAKKKRRATHRDLNPFVFESGKIAGEEHHLGKQLEGKA